ncbi:MAG: MotA/TolQ/ExbB proton channel family protein, partial [Betaproteobacteria bacterium]|nr:MotA/TolQ/ExbB proton channel family protein [Betaproteobacteria bacterium]
HAIAASKHHIRHGTHNLAAEGGSSEFITRAMRRVIDEETARLESGLAVLASVGSTAPFVGLFGTVWGVYHALVTIGMSGQGTLDKVAGPVGEALIMTALGLAVAIPAVLAYNAFVRRNRLVLARLDAFAHDLFAFLTTGCHVAEVRPAIAGAGLQRAAGGAA